MSCLLVSYEEKIEIQKENTVDRVEFVYYEAIKRDLNRRHMRKSVGVMKD